jgi:hypothetical protein
MTAIKIIILCGGLLAWATIHATVWWMTREKR